MDILDHFATYTKLPIKINAIADFVVQRGHVNRVFFHPIEEEPEFGPVPGIMLRRKDLTTYALGEIADIVYSAQWPYALQRLIAAKELIHTTMDESTWSQTRDDVSKLTRGIVQPLSVIAELAKMDTRLVIDHGGTLFAMALLMPRDAREVLLPAYRENKIGDEEMATLAEIPVELVSTIMADSWGEILTRLCPN